VNEIRIVKKMHLDSIEGMSRLFLDSIREPQLGLEPFLPCVPTADDPWRGLGTVRDSHEE